MWRRPRGSKGCNRMLLAVEGAVVVVWVVALALIYLLVKPKELGFFCDDKSIRYPYRTSIVSSTLLLALTFSLPLAIMFMGELTCWLESRFHRRREGAGEEQSSQAGRRRVACGVLGAYVVYFFGYTVLTTMVMLLKMTTGQHRPHFLDVCKPDVNLTDCRRQYITEFTCTGKDESLILGARQSFPSGHAANSLYLAVFMILYLEVKMRADQRHLLRLTFQALLLLYGIWVSLTRVVDNSHHFTDVVVGALLGAVIGAAMFHGAAARCLQVSVTGCQDLESATNENIVLNDNNNNKNDDNDDEDNGEDDNLDHLETETPSTPTPLLFNGIANSASTGLRFGPLRLEGDKHKFSRRATLQ